MNNSDTYIFVAIALPSNVTRLRNGRERWPKTCETRSPKSGTHRQGRGFGNTVFISKRFTVVRYDHTFFSLVFFFFLITEKLFAANMWSNIVPWAILVEYSTCSSMCSFGTFRYLGLKVYLFLLLIQLCFRINILLSNSNQSYDPDVLLSQHVVRY